MTTNNTPTLNENQFMNIQGQGREGLTELFKVYGNQMWAARPDFLDNTTKNKYFQSSILNISNNEKLKDFTLTKTGLFEIYKCLAESIQVGLVVGGENPLCEIAELNKGKLTLNIRAEGYVYLITKSRNSMFKEVITQLIKDGENFSVDYAKNTYIHNWDGKKDLGDIMGVLIEFIKNDGEKLIKYVPLKEILLSRDKSKSHKTWLKEKDDPQKSWKTTPWETDYPQMCLKSAVKIVVKPFAKQIKALSFALSVEEAETYKETPVSERMDDRLKTINDVEKPESNPEILDITPNEEEKQSESTDKNSESTKEKTIEGKKDGSIT